MLCKHLRVWPFVGCDIETPDPHAQSSDLDQDVGMLGQCGKVATPMAVGLGPVFFVIADPQAESEVI